MYLPLARTASLVPSGGCVRALVYMQNGVEATVIDPRPLDLRSAARKLALGMHHRNPALLRKSKREQREEWDELKEEQMQLEEEREGQTQTASAPPLGEGGRVPGGGAGAVARAVVGARKTDKDKGKAMTKKPGGALRDSQIYH